MRTYVVWWPEGGESKRDGREFEAQDHWLAVLDWAEHHDSSCDYALTNGGVEIVFAAEPFDGAEEFQYRVRAEMSVDYYADEVKEI